MFQLLLSDHSAHQSDLLCVHMDVTGGNRVWQYLTLKLSSQGNLIITFHFTDEKVATLKGKRTPQGCTWVSYDTKNPMVLAVTM